MKRIDEIGPWEFSKRHGLLENIEYWSRRLWRDAQRHRADKDAAEDVKVKIFHGVSASNLSKTAKMLRTISQDLKRGRKL